MLYPDEFALLQRVRDNKAVTSNSTEIVLWMGLCEAGFAWKATCRRGPFKTFYISTSGQTAIAAAGHADRPVA